MERCVNLVGTRIVDGDRRAALAWYADHVQQLLADPALHAAVLYERVDGDGESATGMPGPDMVCLYDFVTRERFDAYERGPVRAAAAAARETGWGRDGIEIVLRALHWRVACAAAGAHDAGPPAQCRFTAWHAPGVGAALRRVAAGLLDAGATAWWLLRADAGDRLVVVHAPAEVAPPASDDRPPTWAGRYVRRLQWRR